MVRLRVFPTPVKVKWIFLIYIVLLWVILTWLEIAWHPEIGFWEAVLMGLAIVLVLIPADVGHAFAHIFSARWAGAPMDEILLSAGMPRTLYWNNAVPPNAHRLRAIGGPLFNLVALLLSLAIYALLASNSIVRELSTWSALGHALILIMSLMPLPVVDGGTLLKWTLVARGRTETQADAAVRRLDWGIAGLTEIAGLVLVASRLWIAGGILVGLGMVVIAITAGKIH
ncbi:MAG: hypothetical protein ACM3XO_17275 [Bacteroidota bacterium]